MVDVHKQMTDVRADLETHAFDLSERSLFSAKVGQLLPVYQRQVVPGDYFEIEPLSFLRTQVVNTASYARMRQHIDFFFVPYRQLYHEFPEMKYQREDPVSAMRSGTGKPICSPYMTLEDFYAQILRTGDPLYEVNPAQGIYQNIAKDPFDQNDVANRVRLADLLGYGSLRNMAFVNYDQANNRDYAQIPSSIPIVYRSKHVTIWPWLAYQKIWNDFYRNQYFDTNIDAQDFNLDDCSCDTLINADIQAVRLGQTGKYNSNLDGIFTLRYRQWKQDYFTGLFPDKQFGDISQVVGSQTLGYKLLGNSSASSQNGSLGGYKAANSDVVSPYFSPSGGASQNYVLYSGVSALDIRRAELLQIWKEKTLRAGRKTEHQQIAHFGVASEYIPDDHVKHLGGCSQSVDISEVVDTGANLGELGGKGMSLNNGDKIRFKAKDDGIIMAVFSILPESEYSAFGLNPEHQRIDPFDYFTPAFQNLGFEAVMGTNLNPLAYIDSNGNNLLNRVVGYAPPYYDMKTACDKVHGEFIPAESSDFMFGANAWEVQNSNKGSLAPFDTARREAYKRVGTLPFFYVDPHVVDDVFALKARSAESFDQFFVTSYFKVTAVRPMSVLGLPNF